MQRACLKSSGLGGPEWLQLGWLISAPLGLSSSRKLASPGLLMQSMAPQSNKSTQRQTFFTSLGVASCHLRLTKSNVTVEARAGKEGCGGLERGGVLALRGNSFASHP